jgi:hypothetical protein
MKSPMWTPSSRSCKLGSKLFVLKSKSKQTKVARLELREQGLQQQLDKDPPPSSEGLQYAQLVEAQQAAQVAQKALQEHQAKAEQEQSAAQKALQEHQAKAEQEQEQLRRAWAEMEQHQSELQRQLDAHKRPASEVEGGGKRLAAPAAAATPDAAVEEEDDDFNA